MASKAAGSRRSASRGSRQGDVSATPERDASTPIQGASGSRRGQHRSGSPLSPTRISRFQEKEELKYLNDRLANYIDTVRELQLENEKLSRKVESSEEVRTREVSNIKNLYENELGDARKILDETAKERARLQIELGRLQTERDELSARLTKKEKDYANSERQLTALELRVQDLQTRSNQAAADKRKAEEEAKELRAENETLRKQLAAAKKQLEEETLLRVDYENRFQSAHEELSFKQQLHEKELVEVKRTRQVEITELDGRLQGEYEQKLAETLRELREDYEQQLAASRDEIEGLYEQKLADLQSVTDQYSRNFGTHRDELITSKQRLNTIQSRLSELEAQNTSLLGQVRDLQDMLDAERREYVTRMNEKDEEIRRLQDMMARQLQEYQDLSDIKVALDMEITAYRKLLESEESRLRITPSQGRTKDGDTIPLSEIVSPFQSRRGVKRSRVVASTMEEHASRDFTSSAQTQGDIEIIDQDPEGKYVKLKNRGDRDINIGGWQLHRRVGTASDDANVFKFHRAIVIASGQTVTVWSSDSQVTHSPPSDLVMKNQKWQSGSNFRTILENNTGDEVASRETSRSIVSSSHSVDSSGVGHYSSELYHHTRERTGGLPGGRSRLLQQLLPQQHRIVGDPRLADERCCIM